MTVARNLHDRWMRKPAYRKAHAALAPEFELARAVIAARVLARARHRES